MFKMWFSSSWSILCSNFVKIIDVIYLLFNLEEFHHLCLSCIVERSKDRPQGGKRRLLMQAYRTNLWVLINRDLFFKSLPIGVYALVGEAVFVGTMFYNCFLCQSRKIWSWGCEGHSVSTVYKGWRPSHSLHVISSLYVSLVKCQKPLIIHSFFEAEAAQTIVDYSWQLVQTFDISKYIWYLVSISPW